ncbi:MAG: hypothetical protein Q7U56_14030 [Humidesulfovibrio sp.]|uniref:hypothetical protein n=1 Tax=Humidesulfovibrio sp. TaxID=2910988 RepID=UPI0013A94059|nr:hypothetical protein [Humidesulfovibrio sp.]KAF0234347.1 MAG: hypothetical protein FD177_903 [Desulfovibrionaceae bacterium]MDO9084389.1 hypothetical protein [Humidesulfovibrio sp.]MDQ7836026.1 hypothetical protein [Humidesulfovibrio sp.]
MEFNALTASLLAALVGLISIVVTVFAMKGNSDTRYVTKDECDTQRKLQCQERAVLRDQLDSVKRTLRVNLNMSRALVVHSDIPDETKAAILNNDGGVQ